MNKKIFFSLAFLTLISCNSSISGKLNVATPLVIKANPAPEPCHDMLNPNCKPNNNPPQNKNLNLAIGTYDAKVTALNDKQLALKVTTAQKTTQVILELENNQSFPKKDGHFELKLKGNNLILAGNSSTEKTTSQKYYESEHCTYRYTDTYCDQNGCHQVDHIRNGYEQVEYYFLFTKRSVLLNILDLNKISLADFSGELNLKEKIYTYRGICR